MLFVNKEHLNHIVGHLPACPPRRPLLPPAPVPRGGRRAQASAPAPRSRSSPAALRCGVLPARPPGELRCRLLSVSHATFLWRPGSRVLTLDRLRGDYPFTCLLPLSPAPELPEGSNHVLVTFFCARWQDSEMLCKYLNEEMKQLGRPMASGVAWAKVFLREKQTCPLEKSPGAYLKVRGLQPYQQDELYCVRSPVRQSRVQSLLFSHALGVL